MTPKPVDHEKTARKLMRAARAEAKVSDRSATCGIQFYSQSPAQRESGSYWRECHRCKRPLDYQPGGSIRECQ